MRRLVLTLIMMMLTAGVWASTTYTDPSCTNNGDGTVGYPCASSGGAVGPYNTYTGITYAGGNSYLQQKGTTFPLQVSVSEGGTSDSNRIAFGAYGTGAKPIIESQEDAPNASFVIRELNGKYIIIDGLEIHGQTGITGGKQTNAIRNNPTSGETDAFELHVTITNCTIGPVVSFGAAGNDGIDLRGRGIVITSNTFVNISNDAVWADTSGGTGPYIAYNTCSRVSQSEANGDCYQNGGPTAGIIEHNYCDHSDKDTKQCIVSNTGEIIRYNEVYGFVGGVVNTAIYCDGLNACTIYGNRAFNGKLGIGNYGVGGSTFSNLVVGSATFGIEVAATNSLAHNNTVDNIGAGYAAIRLTAAATNAKAWNNILSDTGEGIRLTSASGHTESNNLFHGTVTTRVYNTTTGGSIAATNPVNATNQFVSESGGDYRTKGNSTARRAGLAWAGCTDLRGRVCWNAPDIGAYQASSGDQAATRDPRTVLEPRTILTPRTVFEAGQ